MAPAFLMRWAKGAASATTTWRCSGAKPSTTSTAWSSSATSTVRACARAAFTTSLRPARATAYSTGGGIEPPGDGGVQTTTPSTPATTAGTTVMATEDGYSARPPGT